MRNLEERKNHFFWRYLKLPEGREIFALEQGEGYKYLGVLEAGDVFQEEMKAKLTKEYFQRIWSILKSKLNGGNVVAAINDRAVPFLRWKLLTGGQESCSQIMAL